MKRIKVLACVLSVAMLAGIFAGCSKTTKITTEKFVKACEKLGLEEFEIDGHDAPDIDDLEDGFYFYADEDAIEDENVDIEGFLNDLKLSEVFDADDISSLAVAAKGTGFDDLQDIRDIDDIADLELDGALAFQMTLADDGYVEDFMDYLDDMLDLAEISTKDLSNKEFYVSKNEGYFRFHVDIAKFGKIVVENDDVMDLVDMVSDADDFEDAVSGLKGDISVSVEINGTNVFVIIGGSVNSKATVMNSFIKAFGAAADPAKVPMNDNVVTEAFENAVDNYSKLLTSSFYAIGATVAAAVAVVNTTKLLI